MSLLAVDLPQNLYSLFHYFINTRRLNHAFLIEMAPRLSLPITAPKPFNLLDIEPCIMSIGKYGFYEYQNFRACEVVEATAARGLIGRIYDRGRWTFVRATWDVIEHAYYHDRVPSVEHEELSD